MDSEIVAKSHDDRRHKSTLNTCRSTAGPDILRNATRANNVWHFEWVLLYCNRARLHTNFTKPVHDMIATQSYETSPHDTHVYPYYRTKVSYTRTP
jgi:hypothetical protein